MDQCTRKRSTTISSNLGLSSQKETQSGKDSCTSCLMHKTRSFAHTLHKDRVSGVNFEWAGRLRAESIRKRVDVGMLEQEDKSSRGLGRRIHGSVEDTKLSTNKQHSLSRAWQP